MSYSENSNDSSQSKISSPPVATPVSSCGTWPRSSPGIILSTLSPPISALPLEPSTSGLSRTTPASPSVHYAELAQIREEPSYANTEITANNVSSQSIRQAPTVCDAALPSASSPHPASNQNTKPEKRLRLVKPLGTSALENKENNRVSYENLHMDHIAALIAEGYAQDAVIRALGIARNDLQMARDILHEFVTKRK